MRIRLDAITRSPASSSILVTAPVRLRRVASGLMIEKVRVTAMTGRSPVIDLGMEFDAPPSESERRGQPLRLLHPFTGFLCPIAPLDSFAASEQLPGKPRALERGIVEEIKAAVV